MLLSTVRTRTDLDGFTAILRPSNAKVTVTGRGLFTATITRMELHDLWMQRAISGLTWINSARTTLDRHGMLFATEPGPGIVWQGAPLEANDIALSGGGQNYCHVVPANSHWGGMSLPSETVARAFRALVGRDALSPNTLTIRTTPSAMARLRYLHATAGHLAEQAPRVVANAKVARRLEASLREAMIGCMAGSGARDDRAAVGRHDTIMRRLRAVLHDDAEEEAGLSELCASVGVSARTLRACCHEYLGMGPKRFLTLRRLHRARRALQDAPPTATVTEIATSLGFWELGRFSVEYRRHFGESPSVTLCRAPR